MQEIINSIVAQWWAIGVLVLSLFGVAITWYRYIIERDKEHMKERDEMMKLHREERKERQERDDKRLAMYQDSNNENTKAVWQLREVITNLWTIIQSNK